MKIWFKRQEQFPNDSCPIVKNRAARFQSLLCLQIDHNKPLEVGSSEKPEFKQVFAQDVELVG